MIMPILRGKIPYTIQCKYKRRSFKAFLLKDFERALKKKDFQFFISMIKNVKNNEK